jgi:hypothetical protein
MPDKEETTHIPATNEPQEEEQSSGSGGLLSAVGDPAGTFSFPFSLPTFFLPNLLLP